MSSSSIRAKVTKLLAKAVVLTGSVNSDKVYLVSKSTTAGNPLSPGVTTSTSTELTNAVFIDYDAKMFNINILAGDRKLVCDNVTIIKQGDEITQGAVSYIVISLGIVAPTSDVLVYMPQVRLK
tara:strand:- start:749 stop:1120 length:372 start_codon:yes stop_codon:yes gene_type:complete